jgi:ATP-dependent helicase HrpA
VFATPAEARVSHERGVARLIRLVMARDFKSYRRDLAVNVQGEIVYRGLLPHPLLNPEFVAGRDLRDDLLDRVVISVFLEGQAPVRSGAAFEARINELRAGIGLAAQEISRTVQGALERLGRIHTALARVAAPAAADVRAQLAWLAPAGFLLTTPRERLQEFPRYLQAIEQRLEKLPRDPRRDAQLAAEIAPLETRYRARVKAERGLIPPGGDEFRWLLEEFRVSLFAQQLGTRTRISARRLEEAWAERERLAVS